MQVTEIAIIGASGYAGGELIRFVDQHPAMEAVYLAAHSQAGKTLREVHPNLRGGDRVLGALDGAPDVDLAFLALPHGASAEPAMALLARGTKVVDLGSDFRLDSAARYREAYGSDHPFPAELGAWGYGIPELFPIAGRDRVAAPGCYPTSAVLALAPLLEAGLVDPTGIVVDSISGVSGAGRDAVSFGAMDESVHAYKVTVHRHRPEMEQALGHGSTVVFTPHLAPMQRGILTTVYADSDATAVELNEALAKVYDAAPFVEVIDQPPQTRWVVGSNRCLVAAYRDDRTGKAVVLSALDNLVKGAAGQAVQCANVMLGLDETAGLPEDGWMP